MVAKTQNSAQPYPQIYPRSVKRDGEHSIVVMLENGRQLRFAKGWADIWIAALSAAWDEPVGTELDQGEAYKKWLDSGKVVSS